MEKDAALLFCPACRASLLIPSAKLLTSVCPACGNTSTLRTPASPASLSLPQSAVWQVVAAGGERLWLAGTSGLFRLDLAGGTPHLAAFPLPHGWRVNGLADASGGLVVSPGEARPFGDPKALLGLDVVTGQVLWEFPTEGFALTPLAADARLACAVDSHGSLLAVKPQSGQGQPAWAHFPNLGDYPRKGLPPILSENLVLAVDAVGHLRAFTRESGVALWTFHPPADGALDFAPVVSGPVAYVLAGAALYRLSLHDGMAERLYQAERESGQGWYFAPPVTDGHHILLLEACWNEARKPAYALHALSAATGRTLWPPRLLDRHPHQAPFLADGQVYFIDRHGQLLCLDATSGAVHWQEKLDDEPAIPPLVADGRLLALTRRGTLYIFELRAPEICIDEPASVYLARGELYLAAGAFLSENQPAQAGLALMQADDWEQARLAFALLTDTPATLTSLLAQAEGEKRDAESAQLSEALARLELERLGTQSRGETALAEGFERAARHYLIAGETAHSLRCHERAAEVMETPRFHLVVTCPPRLLVGQAGLLQIQLTNQGYGPARRVKLRVKGKIKPPLLEREFLELPVGQPQRWGTARIIPTEAGPLVLTITLTYEHYRSGQVGSASFEQVLQVERDTLQDLSTTLKNGATVTIEKFFSPGATSNEIEIADSQGISIGDRGLPAQEEHMDPVTLVITALVAGLTAGLTETAKAAVKDMYDDLKKHLQTKVEPHPDARQALENVTAKPESKPRQAVLAEELEKLEIGADPKLLELAKKLLEQLQSQENGPKYQVNIKDSQVGAVGDGNTVTQNLGATKNRK